MRNLGLIKYLPLLFFDKFNTCLNYWNLYELKKNQDSISKLDRRSFKRAKKWLLKNHPEYIL
jgi:hypothetical protein